MIAYHGASRSIAKSYTTSLRICQPERRPPQLRELISDKLLYEFADLDGDYYHGCFSADARTVALCRRGKRPEIVFLDVQVHKVRSRVTIEEPINEDLVLANDGKRLAVACADQTVLIIDSIKGKVVRRLGIPHPPPDNANEPRTNLTRGAFSPDGQLLAFGTRVDRPGDDWKFRFGMFGDIPPDLPGIRVWNVATGRELRQFEGSMKHAAHGGISDLRFSPDNTYAESLRKLSAGAG